MASQISNSSSQDFRPYRPSRRRIFLAVLFTSALVATLFFVREPLSDLCRTHAALLFSGRNRFATASGRAEWLARHPGELRLAFVGDWEKGGAPLSACRAAFERAINEINGQGGIKGRKLVAEWVNGARTGDALQITFTRLACEAKYFAAFTVVGVDNLLAAKPILLQGRLLTLASGVTNVRLTHSDDLRYVFLTNPSDTEVAEGISKWLAEQPKKVLHAYYDADESSFGLSEELQKAFQARGIVDYYRFPYGTDFGRRRVQVSLARMKGMPDPVNVVLINDGRSPDADRAAVSWLLKNISGSVVLKRPVPGDWSDADRKRIFVTDIISVPEASYRSVWLFADAFAKASASTPEAVAAVLQNEELKTPNGPFRFTSARFAAVSSVAVRPMTK